MQIFTLIIADILFLILIITGVSLDRRISRLEFSREETALKEKETYLHLANQLDILKNRVDSLSDLQAALSAPSASYSQDADKRFNEGVASILAYDSRRIAYPVASPQSDPSEKGAQ